MIIVLKQDAPKEKVHEFCTELEGMGLQINDSKGSDTHILGLIGDTKAIAESWVLANPVVESCRRVSEPYKKANRKFHPDDSVIDVEGVKIGGGSFAVIAGPCSIESEEQITYCAQRVKAAGASLLRGGAFKPRTSPYPFPGMRSEGLDPPTLARRAPGSPLVTNMGLVGRVLRASPHAATVLLITDPGSRIAVFAQQSRSAGILSGQGLEQPLEVGFVERDAPVTAGEILITSGLDGKYPKGIPVATVDSVAPSDSTQFLAVTARPLVDVRRLEEVLLLEPSGINRPLRPSEPAPDFVGPPRPPKRER